MDNIEQSRENGKSFAQQHAERNAGKVRVVELQPSPALSLVDEVTVRRFIGLHHAQATRALEGVLDPGVLQLGRVSPDGGSFVTTQYSIGDVDEMVRDACASAQAGFNVYVEGRTVRAGTRGRGGKEDTRAVFALVIDADADTGMVGSDVIGASLVVQTSPGNSHKWLFLERALAPAEAADLGLAIKQSVGADHDTGVITQPYRVAGTPNYPNKGKVQRGRQLCPTTILAHTGKLWTPVEIQARFGSARVPPAVLASNQAQIASVNPPQVEELVARRVPVGSRSEHFQSCVAAAARCGMSPSALELLFHKHPHGCAERYISEGRLTKEVNRSWQKAAHYVSAAADYNPNLFEPIDLFGHSDPGDLTSLPSKSLPRVLERWSLDQARRKGTSQAFPAVAAVTAAGGAIGNSARIQVKDRDADWTEPAPLWAVLVADPGSTKSEIIKAALAPLKELEAEWRRVDDAKHAEWVARAKAKTPKGELAAPIGPEPRRRRITIDDVTAEAQIHMHAANPRGLIRAPDELAGMLDKMGAYKKGAGGDRSNLLRHFDGDSISVDRVGGTGAYAETTLMGCLAGTQPEKLRPLVRELSSDGLLQRMLFFIGDRGEREEIDEEPDHAAGAEYRGLLRYLASADHGRGARVVLSPGASAVLKSFRKRCKRLRRLPGAAPAWSGHLAKWDKFSARILLIFHAIEHWELLGALMSEMQVDVATAERAVTFCNFVLRHSLAFYEDYFGGSAPASEARAIAGYLLTRPDLKSVTARDIYQARSSLKGSENRRLLLATMEELVDAGWASIEEFDAKGPARWKINTRIHVRFAERRDREIAERTSRQEQIRAAGEERRQLVQADNLSGGTMKTGLN